MWIELGVPAQNWIHLPLYSLKWKTWHFDIFLTDLLIKKDHCYHMLDPETKMPKSQQLLPLVYGQPMKRMVKWPSTMMNLRWSLWTVRFVYSTVLPVPHFKIHTVFIHQESTTCIFKGFYKVYSLFPHKKDVWGMNGEVPYWWLVTTQIWGVFVIETVLAAWPIRSTTQIWVVTRHQYGISALIPQKSLRRETSGGIPKCCLFSSAKARLFVAKNLALFTTSGL